MAQGNMDLSINQTFSETYHEQEKKGGREALIRPAEYQNVPGLKKWKNVWVNIEVCPSPCVCVLFVAYIFSQKREENLRRLFKNSYPLPWRRFSPSLNSSTPTEGVTSRRPSNQTLLLSKKNITPTSTQLLLSLNSKTHQQQHQVHVGR